MWRKNMNRQCRHFRSDSSVRSYRTFPPVRPNMAQLITGKGGKLDFTEADKAEHDKFAATPLGKKFIAAYLKEAIAYEQSKENAVRSGNPNADGFAIYKPENLNKFFNKFVAENYKK